MAKMFYSAQEAAKKLGKSEAQLKDLVRAGQLREFRDGDTFNYKVEDVDAVAGANGEDSGGSGSGSASGEIVLEPVEDSSIELSPSGSDGVTLDESDASATASGTASGTKAKGDTVVPSVGVNVFDDDELDEQVDPLAQTAITDVAGLGMEGAGSGSGILDLTRESDDTSLGKELLDEIYTGEGEATVEMGDDTRAGLDMGASEEGAGEAEEVLEAAEEPERSTREEPRTVAPPVVAAVEYGPDAVSTGLTALLVVAVAVMCFAGLAAAGLVRGITPALLEAVYSNLWVYAAGALGVGVIASGVTFFVAKKRSG